MAVSRGTWPWNRKNVKRHVDTDGVQLSAILNSPSGLSPRAIELLAQMNFHLDFLDHLTRESAAVDATPRDYRVDFALWVVGGRRADFFGTTRAGSRPRPDGSVDSYTADWRIEPLPKRTPGATYGAATSARPLGPRGLFDGPARTPGTVDDEPFGYMSGDGPVTFDPRDDTADVLAQANLWCSRGTSCRAAGTRDDGRECRRCGYPIKPYADQRSDSRCNVKAGDVLGRDCSCGHLVAVHSRTSGCALCAITQPMPTVKPRPACDLDLGERPGARVCACGHGGPADHTVAREAVTGKAITVVCRVCPPSDVD